MAEGPMKEGALRERIEQTAVCSGCGIEMSPVSSEQKRCYCPRCQELGKVKESWMPGNYSIQGVFVVPEKNELPVRRRFFE
jgi:uncharacterized paraquat-inducible protein A